MLTDLSEQNKELKIESTKISDENQKLKQDGKLADLAPTILELMNLEKPEEMTDESLIEA